MGYVHSWATDYIGVLITSREYTPGIGDILYVKVDDRYVLLQVIGYEGEVPVAPSSIVKEPLSKPPLYSLEKTMHARTSLFFEIRRLRTSGGEEVVVTKPYQPPPLDEKVFLVKKGDPESEEIMKLLSEGIKPLASSPSAVPVAWLRSGVAPVELLKKEKYFPEASLNIDLQRSLPKHVLVAGQTGSGKTTCVMGLITHWAWRGEPGLSWLVIDRHGEYSDDNPTGFLDTLRKALRINEELDKVGVQVYILDRNRSREETKKIGEKLQFLIGSVDIGSISLEDLSNIANLSEDRINELDEIVRTVTGLFKAIDESKLESEWVSVFVRNGAATGNLLALIPLLVDNVIRYEGIRESSKRGLYKMLLDLGIDIRKLRIYRRLILSVLGLEIKTDYIAMRGSMQSISVINDSGSVFKVSPILKEKACLLKLLKALASAIPSRPVYPWLSVEIGQCSIPRLVEGPISIDNIVNELNNGNTVIVDVSKIPVSQGDVVITCILRRLFEHRMSIGVEKASALPRIAIVSEEAPLYLSPEKVSNPYNVFARIAREGRKFGIGLVAITQLATQIERQILANFNTVIALRTKYVSDINYFKNIGVPGEALPTLSDREGYLYTPDLSVKEPIPVYFPAYFDLSDRIAEEYEKVVSAESMAVSTGRKLAVLARRDDEE